MQTKIQRRTMALLLSAMLVLTSLPTLASQSVNITSSDPCIRVLSDGIAVLANPSHSVGYISSAKLLDALSCSGGELEYVDSTKNPITISNVTDGFIRIADGSENYTYLPIVTMGETLYGEFSEHDGFSCDGGSVFDSTYAPPGGKSSDDAVHEFNAGESLTTFDYAQYCAYPPSDKSAFTAVVNVYISGGASAQINHRDGTLFRWNSDGTFQYDYKESLTTGGSLEKGRWHQIAITYDHSRFRYHIHIDGTLITDTTLIDYRKILKFGISKGSSNGSVLYDDFRIYRGYYYPSEYEINNENCYEAALDNVNHVAYYDSNIIKSASDLAQSLVQNTNAHSATVYTDSTFSSVADTLSSSSIVAATSENGGRIHYYTVSDDVSTNVSANLNSGVLEANITSNLGGRVLILAAYNDSELASIQLSKLISPGSCNVGMVYNENYSYKTFVRKYDLITPVSYNDTVTDTGSDYSADVIVNNDFSLASLMSYQKKGNIVECTSATPLGSALHLKRLSDTDFNVNTAGVASDESCIIYEFDVMLAHADTAFTVIFEDDKGNKMRTASCTQGGNICFDSHTRALSDLACHNIAFMLDFDSREIAFWYDRDFVGEAEFSNSNFGKSGAWGTKLRLEVPAASTADKTEFYLDNLKVYAATEPLENVSLPLRKISVSADHSILNPTPAEGITLPTEDDIIRLYQASEQSKAHPRLHASRADFEALAKSVNSNAYLSQWYQKLLSKANHLVSTAVPAEYELDSRDTLLSVSREVLENMYTLGMAYQLTGQQKYVDRAWLDLEAVCRKFPDWHPLHDIDTAEMCTAVAIGYDWMYDGLTPLMRKHIESGMYDKGLYEAALAYQMNKAFMAGFANDDDNRNIVPNAGITMASLALLDVYPDECAYLIKNAIHSSSYGISRFAPDGAWWEGPRYWEYAMQYTAKMISSLEFVLGSSFGLDSLGGLDTAAEYMVYMQSSNGVFSYGNSSQIKLWCPEMMWLSNKYETPDITSIYLDRASDSITGGEDLALALLWYNTSISPDDTINLPLDKSYDDGENELITLRQSWDENSPFVGIIAGNTIEQLDGGSFVYDYDGIRWAIDPGAATYTQSGYWDTTIGGQRWKIFKSRAEAHNTIVTNPEYDSDHNLPSYAKLGIVSQSDTDAIITVDTSNLLIGASSGKRGFWYCDDRSSLVVRDEVTLSETGDAYWFMITKADVEVDSSGATLTQGGKSVRLDFLCDKAVQIYTTSFTPLNPDTVQVDADKDTSLTRIIIKLEDITTFNLTVKLTPCAISGTDVSAYNIPISNWKGGK